MFTPNINNPMKINNMKCKLKHYISTMVVCTSYMFEFSVSKDMKKILEKNPTYLIAF